MVDTNYAEIARKVWRTLEPYHGMIYFSPAAAEQYAELGVHGRSGYFASRAAPMGAVSAEVVIATFYNFHPSLVRAAIPRAWAAASPSEFCDARLRAADLALRGVLEPDLVEGPDMIAAAALAERAARAGAVHGRALYAGHASLEWPDEPHLRLWHAATLLREFHGDGHVAALMTEGLDPCEALVSHGLSTDGVASEVLRTSRVWSTDEWSEAVERLEARGLVGDGELTAEGRAQRDRIETLTDRLAAEAFEVLSEDEAARLRTLVRPWSKAVLSSGIFGFSI